METILHEKQEGALCAQHCLNNLLQGQYFSAVDLAQIAQSLDEKERDFMAEGGLHSAEYQNFLEQPSTNFDDSGFFSIQVIQEALRVWSVDLVPYSSQDAVAIRARREPIQETGYICNFRQHWFSVRKLGDQWFNLNSLLTGPELISDTFLSLFLTQLQQEGYCIYIIVGGLPNCEADQILKMIPAVQPIKPSLINEEGGSDQSGDGDSDLQHALEESRKLVDTDDKMLQEALKMSMQGFVVDEEVSINPRLPAEQASTSTAPEAPSPSQSELREKRLAFLAKVDKPAASAPSHTQSSPAEKEEDLSEEAMLQKAMEMSMQQDGGD